MTVRPVLRRIAAVAAGATLALAAGPLAGVAHAAPVLAANGLTPADDAVVQPPEVIRACFTNTIIALSTITVTSETVPVPGTFDLVSCPGGGSNNGIAFTPGGPEDLDEGDYDVSVTARDDLTMPTSATTVTWSFTVDSTAPATPSGLTITNPVNSGNAAGVTVAGTTSPNTDVSVSIANTPTPGSTATGTGTSDGAGAFSISGIDVTALSDGAIRATVTAADEAGNEGSATVDSTKDTVVPARASTVPAHNGTSQTRDTVVVTFGEALDTAGSTLVVKNGVGSTLAGATAFSTTTAANDTMTFTASSNLTPAGGTYTVTTNAVDLAGNAAQTVTSFTIDDTAPGAPTVLLTDPVNAANVTTATVSGIAEPGSTVDVSVDDTVIGSPVTGSGPAHATTGAYSVTVDLSSLSDGAIVAKATATDGAGNTGAEGTSAASAKDTVAPNAPAVDLASPVTNAGQTTVAVSGVAEPGSSVDISVDDAVAGSPVTKSVTADGTTGAYATTVDLTPLTDGTVTATVKATDVAGNTGAEATDTATKDTGVPGMPTLAVPTVNDANETSVGGSGVAEPASTVTVTLSDGVLTLTQSDVADGAGAYAVTFDPSTLADGTLTATATATDEVGNVSPLRMIEVLKDTGVPAAPAITMPAFVNEATKSAIEMSGTAEAASTVNITVSDTDGGTGDVVTSVVAAPNGTWTKTVDLSSLSDGTLTASATSTDGAGNVSTAGTDTAVLDTVAPSAPVVTLTDPINPANAATSAVSGTAEADSTVDALVDDTDAGTAAVAGSGTATGGNFSIPVDLSSLSDGAITATATATDAAGNVSAAGTSAASAKDTTVLAFVSSTPTDAATVMPPSAISVTYNEPLHTTLTTIVVTDGTATQLAGATTFTNGNKTVVFTPVDTLSDAGSPYTVTTSAKDAGNNETLPGTRTFTVDGTAPAAPSVSMPETLNAATDDAVVVTGAAEPGSTVNISVDDATAGSPVTGSTTADGTTGGYSTSLDLSGLSDGTLTATVTATDAVGNVSGGATDTSFKDATAPTAPSISMPAFVNANNKTGVVITGVAEPGSSVALSVDDTTAAPPITASTTASAIDGGYNVPLDLTSLADGAISASAVATDSALNASTAGTTSATKDTVVPVTPSVVLSEPINAANKTTVTVSGIAEPGSAVSVSVDDETPGSALVNGEVADGTTGAYELTFDVTSLADGTLTATVVSIDAASNASAAGTDTALKDSSVPDAPVLATPVEVTHATYTAAPFSGTAEPGSTVTVTVDDADGTTTAVSDTTTADGEGDWTTSLDLSSLKDGTLSVDVTATDPSQNSSGTTSGTVPKNVLRAFTVAVSAHPVSGAAQAVTVTAHQTYSTSSPTETTYTGTPVLSSLDTHFTAGTCDAAVAGVASCSGTVFGDLGAQALKASSGSGDDLVEGTSAVTVQPTALVFSVSPPATASPGQSLPFTVVPVPGVADATITGYNAARTLVTTGGTSTPATGTVLTCPAGECSGTVSFDSRGPKTVKVTDSGTPALSTPTIAVTIPYGTRLTLSRSALTVSSGSSVTISGKLANTTTLAGVAGRSVTIYRKTAPSTTYKVYTTTLTKADGTWAKRIRLFRNTTYKATFAGDATHLAASSPARVVKAAQVVSVAWSTSGRVVKASGRISPNAAGRTIYLQYRKSDGTWAYAGAKAVVSRTGAYTMSRTLRPGRYVLRTAIAATSVNAAGYSTRLGVRIV